MSPLFMLMSQYATSSKKEEVEKWRSGEVKTDVLQINIISPLANLV